MPSATPNSVDSAVDTGKSLGSGTKWVDIDAFYAEDDTARKEEDEESEEDEEEDEGEGEGEEEEEGESGSEEQESEAEDPRKLV